MEKNLKKLLILFIAVSILAVFAACGNKETVNDIKPTLTETPSNPTEPLQSSEDTPALTETPTPSEVLTDTPAPTEVPIETPTPTEVPADTPAPTEVPTDTPAPTEAPTSDTMFTPAPGSRVTFTGKTAALSEAEVGDTVQYGNYEQDNNSENGAEVIEWIVLDKQSGKLLLLSKHALDCKPYDEEYGEVTWETCTLRSWLNGEFYNTAFSGTEQERILTATVKNEDNSEYDAEGGNDTEDKVFLLSIGEMLDYFDPDPDAESPSRQAKVTEYAKEQGGLAYSEADYGYLGTTDYDGNGWCWLRSPGTNCGNAALVDINGCVLGGGDYVFYSDYVVRPAFWLNP